MKHPCQGATSELASAAVAFNYVSTLKHHAVVNLKTCKTPNCSYCKRIFYTVLFSIPAVQNLAKDPTLPPYPAACSLDPTLPNTLQLVPYTLFTQHPAACLSLTTVLHSDSLLLPVLFSLLGSVQQITEVNRLSLITVSTTTTLKS